MINIIDDQVIISTSIKECIDKKFEKVQLERGWVSTAELAYILRCTERTIIRWRSARKQGKESVGIKGYFIAGQYKYFLEDIYKYFVRQAV